MFSLTKIFQSNGRWLEKRQSSILSAALIITTANIMSSLFGLLRERVLINVFFGSSASEQAYEAFQLAFQIPDTLFQLVVMGALAAAFIPIFSSLKKKNEQEAFQFTSIVMNWVLAAFLLLSVLAFIFAEPITAFRTGSQFTPEQIAIAVKLTRLMLFAQLFFAISNFFTGILQAYQYFIAPAIAPVLYNIGIMLGTWLFAGQFGIYSAGIGVLIGAFLHMLVQLPMVWRLGFRWKLNFNLHFSGVKKLFSLMPPRLLTVGVGELQNLAMGFFATSIGGLSFVVVKLASRLMTLPIRFFGVPISQASLPFLSDESEEQDQERFKHLLLQSLSQISFFALPASVLLLILRIPVVRLVFGTYNFPWWATVLTGKIVAIIALSITAQAMVQLLIRAFHALKDTKTPFIISLICTGSYLLVSYLSVYVYNWGVLGLGAAISVAAFLELALFIFFLQKRLQCFSDKSFVFAQLKMILASFFMAVFLYLPFKILDEVVFDTSRTIDLIALTISTGTIALLVYSYFAFLLDIKELFYFKAILQKFGRWREPIKGTDEVLLDSSIENDEL